nr:MAG TPA: hypothetical protein [Bacteriophage sp.]
MSIKIENIQTMGWEGALRGMRNPLNSWDKADSAYASDIERTDTNIAAYGTKLDRYDFVVGQNDLALCLKLIKAGSEHRKFLRMIHVQMDITAPLYWWKEFDTYKVATVTNSCSTMHKIAEKEFDLDDFSCEHLLQSSSIQVELYSALVCSPTCGGKPQWTPMMHLLSTIAALNYYRKKYIEDKNKQNWWQMIQLLPTSYNQRRTIDMSMETALNILHQRSHHKLDEWIELCDAMLKEIPYCQEFYNAMKGEPNGN